MSSRSHNGLPRVTFHSRWGTASSTTPPRTSSASCATSSADSGWSSMRSQSSSFHSAIDGIGCRFAAAHGHDGDRDGLRHEPVQQGRGRVVEQVRVVDEHDEAPIRGVGPHVVDDGVDREHVGRPAAG